MLFMSISSDVLEAKRREKENPPKAMGEGDELMKHRKDAMSIK